MKNGAAGLRERNRLDKLRRIKSAAAKLFISKGFDETTIREVAAQADVGLGTVFVYATTKRDLLFLTVNEDLEAVVTQAAAAKRTDRSMLDGLLSIFRRYYEYFAQEPALSRLCLREMAFYASSPEAKRFLRMRERLISLIESIVRSAMDRKEISTKESSGLVTWVIFAIYQVEIRRWLSSDNLNTRSGLTSLRKQLKLLIDGLSPRSRS
jgi:AcrR family transcriptional regulator